MFPTITASERANIHRQTGLICLPLLGCFMLGYPLCIWFFQQADAAVVDAISAYFLRVPDYSACEPSFARSLKASLLMAHFVVGISLTFVLSAAFLRYRNGQFNRKTLMHLFVFALLLALVVAPVVNPYFIPAMGTSRFWPDRDFSYYCEKSFVLLFPALFPLSWFPFLCACFVSIVLAPFQFVYAYNRQWIDSVSDDPEIAAKQIAIRRKYGVLKD